VSFLDLKLSRAYDTGDSAQDVLHDFYVPVLAKAVSYDRLTGFFSSAALAVAARGIAGLIGMGGSMRLVASPHFTRSDFEVLRSSPSESELLHLLGTVTLNAVDLDQLADEIARNHVRALAWLLANNRLEIRVVVPELLGAVGEGIFHQKVGVFRDDHGNLISFSGSINETAAGWLQNVEEFKVFRSWETTEADWVNHDSALFSRYWNGHASGLRSLPLPDAARERLISYAPHHLEDIDLRLQSRCAQRSKIGFKLREYQSQAVTAWRENNCRGILEMATGTGKTKTAIACIEPVLRSNESSLTVITAPFQHIAVQWAEELKDYQPVCTFSGGNYRKAIADLSADIKMGLRKAAVVVAVQNTAATEDFLRLAGALAAQVERTTLVADEVHGLGAPTLQLALADYYESRLGLSATPNRWYDDRGSEVLRDYFEGTVYTFGIHEALNWVDPDTGQTVLCPYRYYPVFVELDEEELEEYASLTSQIVRQMQHNDDTDTNQVLELLLFKRAGIVKTAAQKITQLAKLLDGLHDFSHALVYCHASEQMVEVQQVLSRQGIRYHRFTGDEGTTPSQKYRGLSEREWILQDLADGNIQALVAIKCLDEGVDVPMARIGIILASSANPREFIQRRGRLLRRAPGKDHAGIYDLVVVPSLSALHDSVARDLERKIFSRELERMDEFARDADNSIEARTKILQLLTTMV
jgi:superfamily II DNA or RNA helicase